MGIPEECPINRHISRDRVTDTLIRSVRVYSPTYAECAVTDLFAETLKTHPNISLSEQPVPGPREDSTRKNLIASLGPWPPALLFVGHVDTIPLQHDEPEPPARVEGSTLFGLGSTDMKSGCAAMVEAFLATAESGLVLKHGVALALVVGEEEYGDGALAVTESMWAPLVIVGEPTNNRVCLDHYGYQEIEMVAQAKPLHAAVGKGRNNAIHALLGWIDAFLDGVDDLPELERAVVSVRAIEGGGSLFVTPGTCRAILDAHIPPKAPLSSLEAVLKNACRRLEHRFDATFSFRSLFESAGYQTDPECEELNQLRQALADNGIPWVSDAFPSHCDAPLFQRMGMTTVVCGPGQLEKAHTRKESVNLDDVVTMTRVYANCIWRFCASQGLLE